jgi:hypothetical protein
MTWINVGCGTHRAPAPWINTDFHRGGDTQPDIVTDPECPIPDSLWPVERMLLSHVLEHMTLEDLPAFFADVRASLAPDAEVLVLGPDIYRTLDLWKAGSEPTALLRSTLEHADYPGTTDWPHATHHWNAHEQRVLEILKLEGFTAEPLDAPPADWPSWSWSAWQFAIMAEWRPYELTCPPSRPPQARPTSPVQVHSRGTADDADRGRLQTGRAGVDPEPA